MHPARRHGCRSVHFAMRTDLAKPRQDGAAADTNSAASHFPSSHSAGTLCLPHFGGFGWEALDHQMSAGSLAQAEDSGELTTNRNQGLPSLVEYTVEKQEYGMSGQ